MKFFLKRFKKLQKNISEVNKERNSVVHQGHFKNKSSVLKVVSEARSIIKCLIKKYHNEFEINEIKAPYK